MEVTSCIEPGCREPGLYYCNHHRTLARQQSAEQLDEVGVPRSDLHSWTIACDYGRMPREVAARLFVQGATVGWAEDWWSSQRPRPSADQCLVWLDDEGRYCTVPHSDHVARRHR